MKRTCQKVLCLLILAASPLSPVAIAHNSRPADFFTTPDTKASGAPEFAGRPQSDSWANGLQNNDGDMPRIDLISAMPSVSGDQRKQLNDLYQTTRKQMQPYYDEITALQKRLKTIRADKSETVIAPPAVSALAAKNTKAVAQSAAATAKNTAVKPAAATSTNAAVKPIAATSTNAAVKLIAATSTNAAVKPIAATSPNAAVKPTAATTTKPAGANSSTGADKTADKSEPAAPAVDLSYIESLQTEEQVNAKLNDAKKKIRDSADLLRDRMFALLTDQQKEEMIAMRHGTLIIDSDARTDLPPPAPPAEKPPAKPGTPPKSPTATVNPATPSESAKPATPHESTKPATPHGSAKPDTPHESTTPATPHESTKPATPHESTKPATPHESTTPATPHESAKPGAASVHLEAQTKASDPMKERESPDQPLMQR